MKAGLFGLPGGMLPIVIGGIAVLALLLLSRGTAPMPIYIPQPTYYPPGRGR